MEGVELEFRDDALRRWPEGAWSARPARAACASILEERAARHHVRPALCDERREGGRRRSA